MPTVISDALASVIGASIVMQLGIWNPFLLFAKAMVCLGGGLLTTIYPGISDGHWIGYQIFAGSVIPLPPIWYVLYSWASERPLTETLNSGSPRYASVSSTRPRSYRSYDLVVWHLNQLRRIPLHRLSRFHRLPDH